MAYLGNSPQFATQIPYRYTIAGVAKTTITGLDDLSKALTYTPGYIAVYVNGVKLIDTQDYTATSGSSVVFVNAVQIGDTVEIIAYGTYSIAYAYRTAAIAPTNAALGDLWYDTTTGILAIYVSDGTTSTWMQIAPTGILDPTLSQFVRTDAVQTATAAQQTQARSNIYAAPLDSLAYNGLQVNGSMDVSQERGTTITTASGSYIVDGFLLFGGGTMVVSAGQVADAPPGLTNSIKITVTTAQTSLGSGDNLYCTQNIEGFRSSRLAFGTASAQSVSIGFWSKIHRIGMYSGSIRNAALNRAYPFTFTQNVADVWEFKTVTIPGDTTGTWVGNTNGVGLSLSFCMASGSGALGTANTWSAGNIIGATGTTNGVAATSDTFQITGLIVIPGIELPSASRAPLIMRSYDQELQLCLRYYWRDASPNWMYTEGISGGVGVNPIVLVVPFKTIMRAAPIVALPTFSLGGVNAPIVSAFPQSTGFIHIQAMSNSAINSRLYFLYSSGSLSADARL